MHIRIPRLLNQPSKGFQECQSFEAEADSPAPKSDTYKASVRAAGRAAVDEALMAPAGTQKKTSQITAESLAAEWAAYAEIYGTNGMASGGLSGQKEQGVSSSKNTSGGQSQID